MVNTVCSDKTISENEIQFNMETIKYDPSIYTVYYPKFIVSNYCRASQE